MFSNFTEETCTATTGDLMLAGATSNRISFGNSFSDGDAVAYVVEDADGSKKCSGIGTYNGTANSIVRNDDWTFNGSQVNESPATDLELTSGTHTVRVDITKNSFDSISNAQVATIESVTGATVLDSSAFGKTHICSGTTADYTVTLPAVAGNAGKTIEFVMSNLLTKFVTLDGNGAEEINGAQTRIMWANESATLMCDGVSWYKVKGVSIPLVGALTSNVDQSVPSSVIVKKNLNANQAFTTNNTDLIDTVNSQVLIKRPSNYNLSLSSRIQQISASTTQENLLYIQGNESGLTSRYSSLNDWPSLQLTHNYILGAGTYIELYVRQYSGVNQNYFNNKMQELVVTEIPQW